MIGKEELESVYHELGSCQRVGDFYGVPAWKISRMLDKYGISKTGWRHNDIADTIVKLFNEGNSMAAISKIVGLRRPSVTSIIKKRCTPLEKRCVICGKLFTTYLPHKTTCSEECKLENKRRKSSVRGARRDRSKDHLKYIEHTYGSEAAYKNYLHKIELTKTALKQQKDRERKLKKQSHLRHYVCVVCGKNFETYNPSQKTCSAACSKTYRNSLVDNRIPPNQIVDRDINLGRLFLRDKGICYLCGKPCNWSDKKDKYTVGPTYPSIDHVIPIAMGGLHAWNNVMLAHHKCNSIKSDKVLFDRLPISQEEAYALKRKPRPRTRPVMQLNRERIEIARFNSVVDAAQATGYKAKQISNCARGEKKTYQGYVWEYI